MHKGECLFKNILRYIFAPQAKRRGLKKWLWGVVAEEGGAYYQGAEFSEGQGELNSHRELDS